MAKYKNVCGQVIQMTSQEETEFDALQLKATEDYNNFVTSEENKETKKTSGKAKLKELGLDDDEIKALTGA
jgi:hypothetical protein